MPLIHSILHGFQSLKVKYNQYHSRVATIFYSLKLPRQYRHLPTPTVIENKEKSVLLAAFKATYQYASTPLDIVPLTVSGKRAMITYNKFSKWTLLHTSPCVASSHQYVANTSKLWTLYSLQSLWFSPRKRGNNYTYWSSGSTQNPWIREGKFPKVDPSLVN